MNYWLVKQEPEDYSWARFLQEGITSWTGVRNFQARNHLKQMMNGDFVLFYHSGDEKQVVGLAKVNGAPFPDPTAEEGDWCSVNLTPEKALDYPVQLAAIKKQKRLQAIGLVRQSRLSVMPLSKREFEAILKLGKTSL